MNQHFGTTSERKETGTQLDLTLDKTTNFWIKVCKSLLTAFSLAVKTLMQNKLSFPHWLPGARTVMIPKCKDPRAKDQRPKTNHLLKHKL